MRQVEVDEGLLNVAAAGVVMGQHFDPVVGGLPVERLDGQRGPFVERLAPPPDQGLIDRFLCQDVLEGIQPFRREPTLVDEVEVFEQQQQLVEVPRGVHRHLEEPVGKDTAEHGGDLQQAAQFGLQAVHPGEKDALDGGRKRG